MANRMKRNPDLEFLASPEFKERVTLLRELVAAPLEATGRRPSFFQRHRGRRARKYLASTAVVKNVNDTVATVFKSIKAAGKEGVTQVDLQNALKLPHSTVWYALKKLRGKKVVTFERQQPA